MTNKILRKDMGYIFLLTIIFLSNIINEISFKIGFILIACTAVFVGVSIIKNKGLLKNKREITSVFFRWNFRIKIVIHIYTIILVILNLTDRRFLSSNIITYLNTISAVTFIFLIGDDAWEDSIVALVLTWIVGLLWSMLKYGIKFTEHVEFHDLGFATGYVFLYYIISKEKLKRIDVINIFLAFLIIIVTNKRIAIGGLLLMIMCHIFFQFFRRENTKQILIFVLSWMTIIGLYIFVYFIVSDSFFELMSKWIEDLPNFFMGRNYYWSILGKLCEFKISFLGFGRNSSATLFTQEYSYLRVGNVHSDILRMYMECGFVLFGIWLYNYLRGFVRAVGKHFGFEAMYMFFIMTLYTFFVYITDNTEVYLITQYFYMLAPMMYCLQKKNREAIKKYTQI